MSKNYKISEENYNNIKQFKESGSARDEHNCYRIYAETKDGNYNPYFELGLPVVSVEQYIEMFTELKGIINSEYYEPKLAEFVSRLNYAPLRVLDEFFNKTNLIVESQIEFRNDVYNRAMSVD